MSDPSGETDRVMNRRRVVLEPELEEMAALWLPAKRFEMAQKMERWARQLRVSARILSQTYAQARKRGLPRLPLKKAKLN